MQLLFYATLCMNCYMLGRLIAVEVNKKNALDVCRDIFVVSVLNVCTFGAFLLFGQW